MWSNNSGVCVMSERPMSSNTASARHRKLTRWLVQNCGSLIGERGRTRNQWHPACFCPVLDTVMVRLRCFWLLWSILAWISSILCTAGCLFPYWLKGTLKVTIWVPNATTRILTSHVGLFRRCVYPTYSSTVQTTVNDPGIALQSNCGHYSFVDIPHFTWKIGLITLVVSCIILFFITFFLFVSGFSISLLANSCVCKLCQFGFLVSGRFKRF